MLKVSKSNNIFKIKLIIIHISIFALLTLGIFVFKNLTIAIRATDFNAGRIIDDEIFYNKNSMNTQQIQNFLDSQIGSCDTWGTQPANEWGRKDITRAEYSQKNWGINPPYVCLNNYHENPDTKETSYEKGGGYFDGGISAAQIIHDAAQKYDINPQVLLVLLKKESSGPLTNDKWPLKNQYRFAMGYACPDSGPGNTAACENSKAGFYKQVNLAAWQLKYYKDHKNDYRYKIGWNQIQYSPDPACGTKHVNIENIATLSLYIYTPYTPNNEALANYPGTSNCGAYGNRNFFMFFNEWFGSTINNSSMHPGIKKRYEEIGGHNSVIGKENSITFHSNNSIFQRFENGFIIGSEQTGYWENYGKIRNRFAQLGYEQGKMGLPMSGYFNTIDNGTGQKYQNGFILGNEKNGYWESTGLIRKKFAQLGYEQGKMGLPTTQEFTTIRGGWFQKYQNGFIIGNPTAGYHESSGKIRERWDKIGNEHGTLGFPTTDIFKYFNYEKQDFEKGTIIGNNLTGYWDIRGDVFKFYNSLSISDKEKIGAPIEPEYFKNGQWIQKFSNGYISGAGNKYTFKIN